MTATDGDKDRPENIVYFLTGQGIDTDRPDQSKFDINKTTGEIFVLKVSFFYSKKCQRKKYKVPEDSEPCIILSGNLNENENIYQNEGRHKRFHN